MNVSITETYYCITNVEQWKANVEDYLNAKAKRGETTVQNKEICQYDELSLFF